MLRSTTVVVRRNTQPVTWVFRPMWPSKKQPRFEPWAAEGHVSAMSKGAGDRCSCLPGPATIRSAGTQNGFEVRK